MKEKPIYHAKVFW